MFLLGKDKFSKALGKYFKKFAFGNTTLDDFIGVLASEFEGPFTLEQWK